MKAKIIHLYEVIAGALLSLLGFGACTPGSNPDEPQKQNPYEEGLAEYGMPHARYIVRGSVSSEESGEPIPGIKAIVRYGVRSDGEIYYQVGVEAQTDENGKVETSYTDFPADKIEVVLEDVDGEKNGGLFQRDTLREDRLFIEKTGKPSGGWYEGEFTVSFDALLKQEAPQEEE